MRIRMRCTEKAELEVGNERDKRGKVRLSIVSDGPAADTKVFDGPPAGDGAL